MAVIGLANVNAEERIWIKEEGHFTLKIVSVDDSKRTTNGNMIIKITFQDKNEQFAKYEFIITPNTLPYFKRFTIELGFPEDYPSINTDVLVGMYVVAWIQKEKVKNRNDEFVDVYNIKTFKKSAKLVNKIPDSKNVPIEYEGFKESSRLPELELQDEEIPF